MITTMKFRSKLFVFFTAALFIFSGCRDAGNDPKPPALSSVYVTNEGNYSDSNGSVTSFNPQMGNTVQQAFQNRNGRPLGGIIQSTALIDGRIYIVLNNADKVEVVDAETFASVGSIPLEHAPVAIVEADEGEAYVSNLYDASVSIIDLETMQKTAETIAVGMNPQAMVRVGERVYVANNGFGNDKTISVINTGTDSVEKTLTVGNGPAQMQVDQSGNIWIVCHGLIAYDENFNRDPENDIPGSLYVVDGETATVSGSIATSGHPGDIALNNQLGRAYLLNGGIWVINMTSMQVETDSFSERHFSALAYSSEEQLIYAAVSNGYTQDGRAIRFGLDGTPADSFAVGIAPNGFILMEE